VTAAEYRKLGIEEGWARLGDEALEAAQTCREHRIWRSSVSRSYYAAYSFIASVLAKQKTDFQDDRVGPEHAPLPEMVRDRLPKVLGRHAARDLSAILRELYEARLTADYKPHKAIHERDAVDAVQRATRVRKLMERQLR
jgi:uncharacterized protein (UPF0332 family)